MTDPGGRAAPRDQAVVRRPWLSARGQAPVLGRQCLGARAWAPVPGRRWL